VYRDLEDYIEELRSALGWCKVEYCRINEVSPETIETLDAEIRGRCGEQAYFQVYGEGILITPRVALASLIRLRRASKRGKTVAKKTYIEYLLRTLGTRKISWSLEASGAMGKGDKIVIIAVCGRCDLGDLGGICVRIYPSEGEFLDGMKKLAPRCLGNGFSEKLWPGDHIEDLEKILLSCGARIEVEG